MKVYAAVNDSWDGIVDIKLFQSEMLAKMFCRRENKKLGFKKYEVREMNVNDKVGD